MQDETPVMPIPIFEDFVKQVFPDVPSDSRQYRDIKMIMLSGMFVGFMMAGEPEALNFEKQLHIDLEPFRKKG